MGVREAGVEGVGPGQIRGRENTEKAMARDFSKKVED